MATYTSMWIEQGDHLESGARVSPEAPNPRAVLLFAGLQFFVEDPAAARVLADELAAAALIVEAEQKRRAEAKAKSAGEGTAP